MLLRSSRAAAFLTKEASLASKGATSGLGMLGKGVAGTAGLIGRGVAAHPRLALAGGGGVAAAIPTVAYGIQQSEAGFSPRAKAIRRATGYRAQNPKALAPMGSLTVLQKLHRSFT